MSRYVRLRPRLLALLLVALVPGCSGGTDSAMGPTDPDMPPPPASAVFEVRGDAEFTIRNAGASDYLFSWTDESGTYTDVADPTLVLQAGATYEFVRATGAHPLRVTTADLPVSGSDGSYRRTTFDIRTIDDVSLRPIEAFTADPAPTSDRITWTPTSADIGDYFYTCTVTSHSGMTGAIRVR